MTNKKHVIRYLLNFLNNKEISSKIYLSLLLIAIAKAFSTLLPWLFGMLLDKLNKGFLPSYLWVAAFIALYVGVRLTSFICNHIKDVIFIIASEKISRISATGSFNHVLQLDHHFFLSSSTGTVMRQINRGIDAISSIAMTLFMSVIPLLMEIVMIYFILLKSINYVFSLVFITTITIFTSLTLKLTHKRLKIIRNLNTSDNRINSHLNEALINFENIKYFNTISMETNKYSELWKEQEKLTVQSSKELSKLKILQDVLISLSLAIFLWLSLYYHSINQITIGELAMIIAYFTQLIQPIDVFAGNYDIFKSALVDMEEVVELESRESLIKEARNSIELKEFYQAIQFQNVSFGYTPDKSILKNINIQVPLNKTIAFVGPSGAGKTSLIKLLVRFYDPTSGDILIDNTNLKAAKLEDLRNMITIISQNIELFHASIRDNILYGTSDISEADLKNVVRKANLEKFIDSLDDGLDTVIGERGLSLSGGERQRIAIARALIRKPKVIVMDEATSSLDLVNEEEILETIATLKGQVTLIIIAHRLQTAAKADYIYVLEKGEIIEEGTHTSLLGKVGLYKKFWEIHKKTPSNNEIIDL